MEHLPIPPACLPDVKPVLCLIATYASDVVYDKLGFEGFPERHGTTATQICETILATAGRMHNVAKDEATENSTSSSADDEAESRKAHILLQKWCWFGLLQEMTKVCGVPINRAADLREQDGQVYLDISIL